MKRIFNSNFFFFLILILFVPVDSILDSNKYPLFIYFVCHSLLRSLIPVLRAVPVVLRALTWPWRRNLSLITECSLVFFSSCAFGLWVCVFLLCLVPEKKKWRERSWKFFFFLLFLVISLWYLVWLINLFIGFFGFLLWFWLLGLWIFLFLFSLCLVTEENKMEGKEQKVYFCSYLYVECGSLIFWLI